MPVKMERKKLNKKIKELQKRAKTFEVGIFNPNQAIKGLLLNYGDGSSQVKRPWFTANMNKSNKDFVPFMTDVVTEYVEGKLSEKEAKQLMSDFCKNGLNNARLKELKEVTILIKAGLIPRPSTGRKKQSKEDAEKIGVDSGKMLRSIITKTRKTKR